MKNLMTAAQLAARWGCSVGALANWRCAGTGPRYVKIGNRIRYRHEDIEEYETFNQVEPITTATAA